jgi:hypothetical protein
MRAPLGRLSLAAFALALLAACGPAKAPPPPPLTLAGWWVGPTLATTWQSRKSWPAADLRSTPMYCSFEIEFFADGTAETNWLNEGSWASMCSFARMPFKQDPADRSILRLGLPGQTLRACRLERDAARLKAACVNAANPPADMRGALAMRSREPDERMGLQAFIGTWQSGAFGDDVASFSVRPDARYSLESANGARPDDGWLSATDKTVELHGVHDTTCTYRATARKLTLVCRDEPAKPTRVVVYTRIR